MILKVGKREVTCFSFDGGGTVGCVRYQSIELITLVGGLAGIICVNLIAQGKVSNYIFGLISAVIIGYFGLVTRVYAEVLYKASILLWTLQGFMLGFGLARMARVK